MKDIFSVIRIIVYVLIWTILPMRSFSQLGTLENKTIELILSKDSIGIPYISSARWKDSKDIIFTSDTSSYHLVKNLLGENGTLKSYDGVEARNENPLSQTFSYTIEFNHLIITWNYELVNSYPILNTWIDISAKDEVLAVEKFPVYSSGLDFGDESTIEYFDALFFTHHKQNLSEGRNYYLHSERYSSDDEGPGGKNPYWILTNRNKIFFELSWCGGWEASITGDKGHASIVVDLPASETQLLLNSNEKMNGPKLSMVFIRDTNDAISRRKLYDISNGYAYRRYKMPEPGFFPLVYNNWYSTRFNIDEEYLAKQVAELDNYGFNLFVVDAGWYDDITDWMPSRKKFPNNSFVNLLNQVRRKKIDIGIWSCPWLVDASVDTTKEEIQHPLCFNPFMNGYALNLNYGDFANRLIKHVEFLRQNYRIQWWKYDQEFIGKDPVQGRMRIISALQDALIAVRQKFPGLYIENCMSGGRMMNELINPISQGHWIRDGGNNGVPHAVSNIKEALGSSRILPLYKIHRWTNRLNEITKEDEFEFYCRSAMIGVWGISTDLSKLSPQQKMMIQSQVKIYRDLNKVKQENIFDIFTSKDSSVTGVVFYTGSAKTAYLMIFSQDGKKHGEELIKFPLLNKQFSYLITNLDTGKKIKSTGRNLTGPGIKLNSLQRLSTIYKIEKY